MFTILNSRWLLSLIFLSLAFGNSTTSYSLQTSANMSVPQSSTIQTFNNTSTDPLITHNSSIIMETEKLIDEIIAIEQVEPLVNNSTEDTPNFLTFEEWKKRKLNLTGDDYKVDEKGDKHTSSKENKDDNLKLNNNTAREIKNEILKNDRLKNEENSKYVSKGRKFNIEDSNNLNGPVGEEMEFEISLFSGPGEEQGKLYKDRFNFASFDCAATIVKTNHEAKSANAILNENKDSYLLNLCEAANKYVIIELCEDILVDEVLIGNFEFYSSMFKEIKISVSDRFPTSQWVVLGLFTAENLRKLQLFRIENPLIWAKFIKIETLSHYGDEYYCPISSIQVHGTTMIEQFKEENPDISGQEPMIKKNEEILNEIKDNSSTNVLIKNDSKAIIYDDKRPKFNVCIDQQSISSTINFDSLGENDDCVVRPYLGLEQFLKDYNSQKEENECKVYDDIISPTTLKVSSSLSSSSSSKSTILTTASVPQDSIYKNIIKRLNLLESNATLSLLYIEEQSKILSNAFSDLESKQTLKFQNILVQLNKTINSQINTFNVLNKELSLNFEKLFNYQSIQFESLLSKSNYQFNSLYQDLSFYKKINYLNLFLILLLIIYIIITRDTYIEQEYQNQNQSGLVSSSHRNHFEKSDQTPSSSPSPLPSPLISPSLSPVSRTVETNRPKIFKKRSKFFDKFLSGIDNKLYNNVNDNHKYEYEYEYEVESEVEIEAENIDYEKLNDDIIITDANLNVENNNNNDNDNNNYNNSNSNKRRKKKAKKRK